MSQIEIESEILKMQVQLEALRKVTKPTQVGNYEFATLQGMLTLSSMCSSKKKLLLIHNMSEACRWCTSWADGINACLPHLENLFSVYLVSKDAPEAQRKLALSRGWRFQMASHGGGAYIREQSIVPGESNTPGIVCY